MSVDHDLYAVLGHRFSQPGLLTQALTHPSIDQGRRNRRRSADYERLEFLGDRVLGLVVADMLYHRYPNEPEGALARRFTALVRGETVAQVAESIGLGAHLAMARGDDEAGGRANPGILADACEAVIGALFADAGFEVAAAFVRGRWQGLMEETAAPPKDAKTALQEWAQGRGKKLPVYTTVGTEGPPHDPTFSVSVEVEGVETVVAKGASKRAAEQAAATQMLENVTK